MRRALAATSVVRRASLDLFKLGKRRVLRPDTIGAVAVPRHALSLKKVVELEEGGVTRGIPSVTVWRLGRRLGNSNVVPEDPAATVARFLGRLLP